MADSSIPAGLTPVGQSRLVWARGGVAGVGIVPAGLGALRISISPMKRADLRISRAEGNVARFRAPRYRVVARVAVAVVALAAAVVATGALRSSATEKNTQKCTMTATKTAPGGVMTICVHYQYTHNGKTVKISSVKASYKSRSGYALPSFSFALRNSSAKLDDRFASRKGEGNAIRAYHTAALKPKGHFTANEDLSVELHALNTENAFYVVTEMVLQLSLPSFACPTPSSGSGSSSC